MLRDGATAGAGSISEFTPSDVVRMMLGTSHSQDRLVPLRRVEGSPRFSVKGLSRKGAIEDVLTAWFIPPELGRSPMLLPELQNGVAI